MSAAASATRSGSSPTPCHRVQRAGAALAVPAPRDPGARKLRGQRRAAGFRRLRPAHIARLSAERAYTEAAIAASDVAVAEVHDATAFGEVLITEMLGLREPREVRRSYWSGLDRAARLTPTGAVATM